MTQNNALAFSVLLACAAPGVALAQTAYLEQSGIVGQGKLLTISRLPATTGNGMATYYDGTINITVNAAGVPSIASSSFVKSKTLKTQHFVAGRYYVKYGNNATQFGTLSEGVGSGGSTVWSLVMDGGPNGYFPEQATWQTGTPAPDVEARLAAAKTPINSEYSYGLTIVGSHLPGDSYFYVNNGLLAAEQVSDTLIVMSYTTGNGQDSPTETGSIVLGLCTDATCSTAPQ